jgi:hypothetical protein
MSGVGFEALAVLLVLLPGFVAARTVQGLCVRPTQTELDKVVEALLYSFLIYVVFVSILHRIPLSVVEETSARGVKTYSPQVQSGDLLLLLTFSLILGLGVSGSVTNDLHGRLFRLLHLTQRTTRSSIWGDVFHDLSFYVQVQFCDGRKLIGWPRYFSDTPEESSLFLEAAAWVKDGEELQEIPGPGILITKNMPIETIMFLKGHRVEQTLPQQPSRP